MDVGDFIFDKIQVKSKSTISTGFYTNISYVSRVTQRIAQAYITEEVNSLASRRCTFTTCW